MKEWLTRTELLIGKENIEKLEKARIAVFGCGGVGSYVVEALVRTGIGTLLLIDNDTISVTNINRQLMADTTNIGELKVEAMRKRILKINPSIQLHTFATFATKSTLDNILANYSMDYVVDAIDTVTSKLDIIEYCHMHSIPILSCMGTGNKLNPSQFEITDITKTSVCPLAKVIRKELRTRSIPHLKVLYSKEQPKKNPIPASISFVPSVAGLLIAGEVICDILADTNSTKNQGQG